MDMFAERIYLMDGYYSRLLSARVGSRRQRHLLSPFESDLSGMLDLSSLYRFMLDQPQLVLVADIVSSVQVVVYRSWLPGCIDGFWFICWFLPLGMEEQLSSVGRRSNADGLAFNELVPLFQGLRRVPSRFGL